MSEKQAGRGALTDRRSVMQGASAGLAAAALMRPGRMAAQEPSGASSVVPVVDVHTHMYTEGWLNQIRANPDDSIRLVRGESSEEIDYRGARIARISQEMLDWDLRISNMDAAGVDIAMVSLTAPNVYVASKSLSIALARQVNDDFAAEQERHPARIRWLASLPWEHPAEALSELARIRGNGASGLCMLTNILGTPLTDSKFAPIWEAIEDSGLPVFIHPTTPFVDGMGLQEFGLANTIGFTTETSLCFARMFLDGMLDRYPDLKLIACHGGGALPYLVGRFDRMWERTASPQKSSRPPSDFLDKIWYDAIVYDQQTLEFLVEQAGPDRVLYGSDYPFLIGDMEGVLHRVNALDPDRRDAIRGRNAKALFSTL
jgi:aminocarboxymuconate-semialdehyde decarboxylase